MSERTDTTKYRDVYDPRLHPKLFDSVRTRRVLAFLIDIVMILLFTGLAGLIIFVLGILTLGLGWLLFALLWPGVAILYYLFAFAGTGSATPGMRAMGIELRLWYGARAYALLGTMHAVLFYATVTVLTPLVLFVSLFSARGRLLHDIALGTVVVDARAAAALD